LEHTAECYILNIKRIARKTVVFLAGIQLWAPGLVLQKEAGGHSPHAGKSGGKSVRKEAKGRFL